MTENTTKPTPGPCPFCGAAAKHRFAKNCGLHWFECTGCEADGPAIYDYEKALAAWNRRDIYQDVIEIVARRTRDCGECNGTGVVQPFCDASGSGISHAYPGRDEPCPDCTGSRAAISRATGATP